MIEKDYHYKICTICLTYNHASYIEDAMNGFVIQETSFPVVTVIVDDASTDGEQDVIRNYLKEHFQNPYRVTETEYAQIICSKHKKNNNCDFVVLLLKYNHHSIKKPKMPYLAEWVENSKYQALCEGDDYWSYDNKLQEQVNYLDNHPNCGLHYAKAKKFEQESGSFKGDSGRAIKDFKCLLEEGNYIPTLTTLYRSSLYLDYMEEVGNNGWLLGDYPYWLYFSYCAELHFEDKCYGVYRVLKNSGSHFTTYESHVRFENSVFDVQLFFARFSGLCNKEKELLENKHYIRLFHIAYQYKRKADVQKNYMLIKHKSARIIIKHLLSLIFM